MQKNHFKLGLDVLMALSLLFIMVPKILGQSVHEWAGLVIAAVFITHIIVNWKWIKMVTTHFLRRLPFRTRFNYILNLLVFAGFAAIIVSGVCISETIDFSWLGIARGGGGWKMLHKGLAFFVFSHCLSWFNKRFKLLIEIFVFHFVKSVN